MKNKNLKCIKYLESILKKITEWCAGHKRLIVCIVSTEHSVRFYRNLDKPVLNDCQKLKLSLLDLEANLH